jgi:hypothetical protein
VLGAGYALRSAQYRGHIYERQAKWFMNLIII